MRMNREISARRLRHVPAPAVVRRDGERKSRVGGRLRLAGGDELANAPVEHRQIADHLEPDPVGVQLRDFLLEGVQEEVHQDRDLLGRATPVLAREREQREEFDIALDAGEDDRPHGLDAAAVTGDTGQHPLLRPAAVAVHDDRDVARNGGRCGHFARGALKHVDGVLWSGWEYRGRAAATTVRSPSGRPLSRPAPCRFRRCGDR